MTEQKRAKYPQVGVRLSKEEYEAVKREAERRGWSMGQTMRRRALKGLTVREVDQDPETELKAVGQ